MSHQVFISPSNSRLNRSSSGSSLSFCSTFPGDRRAQQALYMGCSSNPNIVSFSPSGDPDRQYNIPSSGPSITPYHMTLPSIHHHSTPQVMYPSANYFHGNPGFYYDLMQNSTHTGSQTIMHPTPTEFLHTSSTSIPTHKSTSTRTHTSSYIPSNPTIHFGDISPPLPTSVFPGPSVDLGGSSSTTPFASNFVSSDVPFVTTLDPESRYWWFSGRCANRSSFIFF